MGATHWAVWAPMAIAIISIGVNILQYRHSKKSDNLADLATFPNVAHEGTSREGPWFVATLMIENRCDYRWRGELILEATAGIFVSSIAPPFPP